MTDRELLEAAAKAAGKEHYGEYNAHAGLKTTGGWWNPLTDDGDALRLAVKLGIHVTNGDGYAWASASNLGFDCTYPFDGDPDAATRRAIVRAAAAISKEMK